MSADDELDRSAIIGSQEHSEAPSGWIRLTPHRVAIFSIQDCAEQLARSVEEPIRLAQAAKSAHLAVQAALTAALSGSMNIGAYPEKLRREYLAYFNGTSGDQPESNRVMPFNGLLKQAATDPLEWTGKPLSVTDDQLALLDRLGDLRDGIEHPKPLHWSIEVPFILEVLPVAADLTVELLVCMAHQLEQSDVQIIKAAAATIATLSGTWHHDYVR